MMDAVTTAVFGSSCFFSSAATDPALASVLALAAAVDVAAITAHHGTTDVDVTTAVAANSSRKGFGGIFGCPSSHGSNPAMIETLKLFLPYFPLHIQNLICMYLKLTEFMHTFEMVQNMMNHMNEYQVLFQSFESMFGDNSASAPFFGNDSITMPDISSLQKMMEGGNLVDEFTYVEEPSGTGWNGS